MSTLIFKTQHCTQWVAVDTHWLGSTPTIHRGMFCRGFSIATVHRSCFISGHQGHWSDQRTVVWHNGKQMDCDKNRRLGTYRNQCRCARHVRVCFCTLKVHNNQVNTVNREMSSWTSWSSGASRGSQQPQPSASMPWPRYIYISNKPLLGIISMCSFPFSFSFFLFSLSWSDIGWKKAVGIGPSEWCVAISTGCTRRQCSRSGGMGSNTCETSGSISTAYWRKGRERQYHPCLCHVWEDNIPQYWTVEIYMSAVGPWQDGSKGMWVWAFEDQVVRNDGPTCITQLRKGLLVLSQRGKGDNNHGFGE